MLIGVLTYLMSYYVILQVHIKKRKSEMISVVIVLSNFLLEKQCIESFSVMAMRAVEGSTYEIIRIKRPEIPHLFCRGLL